MVFDKERLARVKKKRLRKKKEKEEELANSNKRRLKREEKRELLKFVLVVEVGSKKLKRGAECSKRERGLTLWLS